MNIAGRILVVDGVPTTRISMKVSLSSACYEVVMASSGAEALRLHASFRPQIVLIAASLPDMSTAQLCLELRARPGGIDLPILAQAQGPGRIAALRAGASALIDQFDDLTLLARIRGLIRHDPQAETATTPHGMAEAATPFAHDPRPRALCIAGQPAVALGWRHALQARLDFAIAVCDHDRALADAARGNVPEIYLIAADMNQPGDGLRLLCELRSRPVSRDAGFLILLRPEREDMTAIALDLGAGDVLPANLGEPVAAAEAALRIETQLARKRDADRRRIEAQRQIRLASVDPLTGLYNRRHALPRLALMHQWAMEHREPLAVIMIDLDRFKAVNDQHGHAAGDAVLRSLAQRLRLALPPDSLLARMGGEEFMIALSEQHAPEATAIAEELRRQVQAMPVSLPPECALPEIHVTMSAGIAVDNGHGPLYASGPEQLVARADRALLAAKAGGRNRIVMATAAIAA